MFYSRPLRQNTDNRLARRELVKQTGRKTQEGFEEEEIEDGQKGVEEEEIGIGLKGIAEEVIEDGEKVTVDEERGIEKD